MKKVNNFPGLFCVAAGRHLGKLIISSLFCAQAFLAPIGLSQETNQTATNRIFGTSTTPTLKIGEFTSGPNPEGVKLTRSFLNKNRERYEQILARARQWLDRLAVDPIELRVHGIKGKKKLAEILDTYFRIYSVANPQDKQNILIRVKTLTVVTSQTNYHDMLVINDLEFKQDATSYLRVAYLMERFGLDTKFYRAQIDKVYPRLNEHMSSRGVDQRMAFHWYYEHFGLKEPFPLESAFQTGLIASRKQVDWFKQTPMEAYNLTHEVFAPYKFGENLDADFFTPDDKVYLRGILTNIMPWYVQRGDPDLTAEFILCAAYLKFIDLPVYLESLNFLLESQNKNGSWGQYEQQRQTMGNYVEQGLYLHTTMVALDALVVAFELRAP